MRGSTQLAWCSAFSTNGAASLPKRFSNSRCQTLRRRVRVVAQPAEHLEEMPVALELVVVVAMGGRQQVERLRVVRLGLHLRAERLVHLEAVAVVEAGAFGEAARVVRIAPQQHARGAAVPEAPVHLVALRVAEHVRVGVAAVELVLLVDVRGMKRQAHLLHPILGGDAERHAHVQRRFG